MTAERTDALPRGGQFVLDEPLPGARRTHRALIDVDFAVAPRSVAGSGLGTLAAAAEALQAPAPEDGKSTRLRSPIVLTLDKHEFIVDHFLRRRGARKSAAGARAVQFGNVGAAQSALSAGQQHDCQRGVAAALLCFFRAVQEGAHLFHGVTDSTMSHGEGWQYIQLGRFVERTDALARLIGAHFCRLPLDRAYRSGGRERRVSGVGGTAEILRCI
jgi:hypothetical protein